MGRIALILVAVWALVLAGIWIWLAVVQPKEPETRRSFIERVQAQPLVTYAGRVVDDLGERVPDVTVSPISVPTQVKGRTRSSTDLRGQFSVEVPTGCATRFVLSRPGYVRREIDLLPGDENNAPVYVLARGAEIQGRLIDPAGKPIAGATLNFSGYQGWKDEVVTSKEGRFASWGPPGPIVIHAHSDQHADAQFLDHVLEQGRVVAAELTLGPGSSLTLFIQGSRGEPVAGARVTLDSDAGDHAAGRTQQNGEVTFDGLGGSTAHLQIVAAGHGEREADISLPAEHRIPVRLPPACPWKFEIHAPNGHELVARVTIRRGILELATVDSNQVNGLNILTAGSTYIIEAEVPGFPVHRRRFQPGPGASNVLHVDLSFGGVVSGRIVDASSRPVPHAQAVITRKTVGEGYSSPRLFWSAGDGRFRTDALEPGVYRLNVSAGEAGQTLEDLEIVPGADLELGNISLGL